MPSISEKPDDARYVPDATLPDDRGVAIAYNETNVTEQGEGGVDHKHDYWAGRESVVILDAEIPFGFFPMFPDGEGTQPRSVVHIKPARGLLVYEGAKEVEVVVRPPDVLGTTYGDVPHPAPSGFHLSWRTAAEASYGEPVPVVYDTPIVIPVSAKETDMPHSVASLWAFRFATERSENAFVNLTVTVRRGGDVVDWPGHPDFYAERSERLVFDGEGRTNWHGATKQALYGYNHEWVHPDKLVSHGTGWLDVHLNVTAVRTPGGDETPPAGFVLYWHNATTLDTDNSIGGIARDLEGGDAFTDPYYHFIVPVTEYGMDGPYQPASLWGLRLVATGLAGKLTCGQCLDYEVDYTMTILAHTGPAPGTEEGS